MSVGSCACPTEREPVVREPLREVECSAPALTATSTATPADALDVLASAVAGDVIELDGEFGHVEGVPDGVTLTGADGATVTSLALGDANDVTVRGLAFINDQTRPWVSGTGEDVTLLGNAFDVDCFGCGDEFAGIDVTGARWTLCGNRFGSWMGDMIVMKPVEEALVENNDFSLAQADHAVLTFLGSDLVVRGNFFRNPWDRVLHVASLEPDILTARALIERNVFFDSDWDRVRPRENAAGDTLNDGGGALEAVRLIGRDHIFRGNLVLATRIGNESDCHGGVVVSTFVDEGRWVNRTNTGLRAYHNTFVDNARVGFAINDFIDDESTFSDNRLEHNVFAGNTDHAWRVCANDLRETRLFARHNVYEDGATVRLPTEEAISPLAARAFLEGERAVPFAFVQREVLSSGAEQLSLASRDAFFDALQLETPVEGLPLTRVVEAVDASVRVRVGDASYFRAGTSLTAGDRVRVGDEERAVMGIDGDVLELDAPVSADVDTAVTWAPAASVGAPPS